MKYWAQICGPSAISVYLHGFLFNELSIKKREDVKKLQVNLASLFSYVLRHGLPMEQIQTATFRDAMFRARNAEEALLVVMNSCSQVTREISKIDHADRTAFGAWFKRIQGQRSGAESSLAAKCLSFLSLARICLDIADLYGANLENSDLSGADLHVTCLERADLRGANLSGAKCWNANCYGAVLVDANLAGAGFERADLRGAILENVQLGSFKVRGALFEGVHPEKAREALVAQAKKEQQDFRREMKGLENEVEEEDSQKES